MLALQCTALEISGQVAHAKIDWPGGSGAWAAPVREDLSAIFDWIEDEGSCHRLVLRPQADSASSVTPPDIEQCRRWEKLVLRLDRLPCASVAVVDGPCMHAWMQLALACDLRIATRRASFRITELQHGYLPGMNTFRLAKYLGLGTARRLMFTAAAIDADEAKALAIVDQLCDSDGLDAALHGFLATLEPLRPPAVQLARRLMNESFATAFEDFMGQYLASQDRCLRAIAAEDESP